MAWVAVHLHCICGAPDIKARLRKGPVLDQVRAAWQQLHTGPGHAPRPDVFSEGIKGSLDELRDLFEAAGLGRPS